MDKTKKEILISEYNSYKVMKTHYEVSLAAIQSRMGDINTQLMFNEAEELQKKGEAPCKI